MRDECPEMRRETVLNLDIAFDMAIALHWSNKRARAPRATGTRPVKSGSEGRFCSLPMRHGLDTSARNTFDRSPVDKPAERTHLKPGPVESSTRVHFEEDGSALTAVEIDHRGRSPVIGKLHHVLFALGIVVSTYQVRAVGGGIVERLVLQRRDGASVSGELGARARAAVLPVAFENQG
jgi:hypothetical protein